MPGISLGDLALAEKHGIPTVELRTLGGSVDLPTYFAARFGSPEQLAAHLRDSRTPVRIAALDASRHLVSPAPDERDQLIAFAPWAEALGVRWLRVFDGGRLADAAEIAAAAETVRWWREERDRHGWQVDIMIETHDSLWTAAAVGRLLTVVPDAAILWDSHHTEKGGGPRRHVARNPCPRGARACEGQRRRAQRAASVHLCCPATADSIAPLLAALRGDGLRAS